MPIRIPIQFLNRSLQPVSRPHEGRPMAYLTYYKPVGITFGQVPTVSAWTLFDTGADQNYADTSFVESMGWPHEDDAIVIGATGTEAAKRHTAGVLLPGGNGVATQITTLSSAHDQTKAYQVILGNLFMEVGHLHMDYVRGEFWFEFYPRAERELLMAGSVESTS